MDSELDTIAPLDNMGQPPYVLAAENTPSSILQASELGVFLCISVLAIEAQGLSVIYVWVCIKKLLFVLLSDQSELAWCL